MLTLNDPTLLKNQCYVDGAWVGSGLDDVENPATGDVLARVPRFGATETIAAIYRFKSEEEVISLANATPFGLAAYFYARDVGRVFRVAEELEYGMVGINAASLGTEVAPYGGVKESGLGREGSHHGMEEFVELKYILLGGLGG